MCVCVCVCKWVDNKVGAKSVVCVRVQVCVCVCVSVYASVCVCKWVDNNVGQVCKCGVGDDVSAKPSLIHQPQGY